MAAAYEFHLVGTKLSCLVYITHDFSYYRMHDQDFQAYERNPIAEFIETGVFYSMTRKFLLHTKNQSVNIYCIPTEAFEIKSLEQEGSLLLLEIKEMNIKLEAAL